jgi:hypothetical protein
LRRTLKRGSTGLDFRLDLQLESLKKGQKERPQEEQTEIKQNGPYSCIVLAVLEIERQGEGALGASTPGRV